MTCPYCLRSKPETSTTFSQHDFDGEIEHLDGLISRLVIERSRLGRKRNETQSPIYSLPTETLTLIFKLTCPPLDFLLQYGVDGRLPDKVAYPRIIGALSAVSTRWHDVVLSTPSLWTSFIADDRDMRLMRTVFARSDNLPVSVSVDARDDSPLYESRTALVVQVLQEYSSRIHRLFVRSSSFDWLNDHISDFIGLEHLSLESHGADDEEVIEIDSSCPHLTLMGFECCFSLSWSKIEVLHLDEVPVDVCLEMLEKCTNLIEYRIADLFEPAESVKLPSSPFVLPCMKLFEWAMSDSWPAVDRAMLRYCRMPALQTLVWSHPRISEGSESAVSIFFENLSSTLTTIRIGDCRLNLETSIFPYCLNLSHLEDFVFMFCAGFCLDGIFRDLGSKTYLAGNQEMPVLPNLKSIQIQYLVGSFDQANFLRALRRRYSTPLGLRPERSLRLKFGPNRVDWTRQFRKGMVEMVKEGYKVELWECSKPVDWLPRASISSDRD